mgnify:CR=1 FL=1
MSLTFLSQILLFGLLAGLALGLIGGGGSLVGVPLLAYGLGLSPHQAICTVMLSIGVIAGIGAARKFVAGELNWRIAGSLIPAGWLGALTGVAIGRFFSAGVLMIAFGVVVVAVAAGMLTSPQRQPPSTEGGAIAPVAFTPPLLAAAGGAGILAGLFGVGGGFVLVPALNLIGRLEIHRAISASWFVIALNSVAATGAHVLGGQTIPPGFAGGFALGTLAGFELGSRFGSRCSETRLRRIFGVALAVMAIAIIIAETNVHAFAH